MSWVTSFADIRRRPHDRSYGQTVPQDLWPGSGWARDTQNRSRLHNYWSPRDTRLFFEVSFRANRSERPVEDVDEVFAGSQSQQEKRGKEVAD